MNRNPLRSAVYPSCPIRNILARICDKWSLLLIYTLKERECMRFNALQREIPDISQKMLTVTLRTLEEDGLIDRKIYAEVPPRVEYTLTEVGYSLKPIMDAMWAWGEEYKRRNEQNA